jgi:hypothetical protein
MRLTFLFALALATRSSAFYFNLDQKLCFADEVGYEREPAHVHYQIPSLNHKDAVASLDAIANFVEATVSDPENNIIHHEVIKDEEGSFSFLSTGVAGEYHICFEPSPLLATRTPKLMVEVESGAAIDYTQIQTKDAISKVERALHDLKGQMNELRDEMNYVMRRQVPFQRTSESTYRRVWAWSVVQVLILVFMMSWQVWNLKSFFMAKKLV